MPPSHQAPGSLCHRFSLSSGDQDQQNAQWAAYSPCWQGQKISKYAVKGRVWRWCCMAGKESQKLAGCKSTF